MIFINNIDGTIFKNKNYVLFTSPTIIELTSGKLRVFDLCSSKNMSHGEWMFVKADTYLWIEFDCHNTEFKARSISFTINPESTSKECCLEKYLTHKPRSEVKHFYDLIFEIKENSINFGTSTELFLIKSFYAELNRNGLLSGLFHNNTIRLYQRIKHLIAKNPTTDHSLISASHEFSITTTNLIKNLSNEGSIFSHILDSVRLFFVIKFLLDGKSIEYASIHSGFNDTQLMSRKFTDFYGENPFCHIRSLKAKHGDNYGYQIVI
ncbi:helix-turn-helix transcriptional regulator [Chitinibacter fontanus]|uniref:Helix-turn-helix transcriptional regulator n=1 Tax=Chitinibacter fontanus TaxID=1737446 RepID=A0A7D5VB85_9NEIS|nr:helix-turn-helix transcriptional regulator [Chitinibacter fontanus]QLI82292.1 helix-turn-helix transcriptional regulator [Chitinibacter fontanus]